MVKFFIIISSGLEAKEKALTGMMFAKNSKKRSFAEDTKVIFFGPSEKAIAQGDPDFIKNYKDLVEQGILPTACVAIAERDHISDSLNNLGITLEPVGRVIAKYASEGYNLLTF